MSVQTVLKFDAISFCWRSLKYNWILENNKQVALVQTSFTFSAILKNRVKFHLWIFWGILHFIRLNLYIERNIHLHYSLRYTMYAVNFFAFSYHYLWTEKKILFNHRIFMLKKGSIFFSKLLVMKSCTIYKLWIIATITRLLCNTLKWNSFLGDQEFFR